MKFFASCTLLLIASSVTFALDLSRFLWTGSQKKEAEIVEIVRWRQPVCIHPAEGVSPCMHSLGKFEKVYEVASGKGLEKGRDLSGSEEEEVSSEDVSSLTTVDLESSRGSEEFDGEKIGGRTAELTEDQERRIIEGKYLVPPKEKVTRPEKIFVTKVLNAPVTATLVAYNCIPDVGIPLCENYQENVRPSKTADNSQHAASAVKQEESVNLWEVHAKPLASQRPIEAIGQSVKNKKPEITIWNPDYEKKSTSFTLKGESTTEVSTLQHIVVVKDKSFPDIVRNPGVFSHNSPAQFHFFDKLRQNGVIDQEARPEIQIEVGKDAGAVKEDSKTVESPQMNEKRLFQTVHNLIEKAQNSVIVRKIQNVLKGPQSSGKVEETTSEETNKGFGFFHHFLKPVNIFHRKKNKGSTVKPEVSVNMEPEDFVEADILEDETPELSANVKPDAPMDVKPEFSAEVKPEVSVEPEFSEDVKPEAPVDVKAEVPVNVSSEFSADVKPEIPVDVKPEVPMDVSSEFSPDVKQEFSADVKPEVPQNVSSEFSTEVKPEIPVDVKPQVPVDVSSEFSPDVKQEFSADVKPEVPLNVSSEFSTEVKPEIPVGVKPEVPVSVRPEFSADVKQEFSADVKPKIPVDVSSEFSTEVKPEIPMDVKPEIPVSVRPEFSADVKQEFSADVKPEIPVDVKPQVPVDVSSEFSPDVKQEFSADVKPEVPLNVSSEFSTEVKPEIPVDVSSEFSANVKQEFSVDVKPEIPVDPVKQEFSSDVKPEIPLDTSPEVPEFSADVKPEVSLDVRPEFSAEQEASPTIKPEFSIDTLKDTSTNLFQEKIVEIPVEVQTITEDLQQPENNVSNTSVVLDTIEKAQDTGNVKTFVKI
ncbi:Sialidase [Habropoda laboriosa]|uniref:Sialidase n=1 Tax=Habropoda laboriosa TaxID=597456 RepID=A0A0L7QXS4_9HYME|nr:Sialidase [Habropoda laboriosa]